MIFSYLPLYVPALVSCVVCMTRQQSDRTFPYTAQAGRKASSSCLKVSPAQPAGKRSAKNNDDT